MDNLFTLLTKYNIQYTDYDTVCHATGIGDILFRLLSISNNLIDEPFYINLNYFKTMYYDTDPIMQLEFRIKLIMDLLKYNNISNDRVKFIFSNNYHIKQFLPYDKIIHFNLNLKLDDESEKLDDEYIIFHTKCRHLINEDYVLLKKNIKDFCKNNKSKYKIIIMGERKFPYTEEVGIHGICTVYDELLELNKNNNNIIDNSIEYIYNNLNYDNYKKDIKLIKRAKYNICFGIGGQFCTSAIFGECTIVYCEVQQLLNTEYFNKNNFWVNNQKDFFNLIKEKCFI